MGKRARCRGVTLVEVLVSMGVVSILAGIAIPTIAAANRAAKRTGCQAQLSDHMKVVFAYATDTRGVWPDASEQFLERLPRTAELAGETIPEVDGSVMAWGASAQWPAAVLDAYDENPFHRSLICPSDWTVEESAEWAEATFDLPRTQIVGMQSYALSTSLLIDPLTLDPDDLRPVRFAPQRVDRVAFPSHKAALYDGAPYHDPGEADPRVVSPPWLVNVAAADGSAGERSTADVTPGVATHPDDAARALGYVSDGFGGRVRPPEPTEATRPPEPTEATRALEREARKLGYTPHGVLGRDWGAGGAD